MLRSVHHYDDETHLSRVVVHRWGITGVDTNERDNKHSNSHHVVVVALFGFPGDRLTHAAGSIMVHILAHLHGSHYFTI